MKITEAELAMRRERIIDEAFHLFLKHGIDGVSMKEIAAAAGVSEKSIYRYFGTKPELISMAVVTLWDKIVQELCSVVDDNYYQKSGYEQLSMLLDGTRILFEKHSDYVLLSYDYKLFLARNKGNPDATHPDVQLIINPIERSYIDAIKKGQLDGTVTTKYKTSDIFVSAWGLIRGYTVKVAVYGALMDGEEDPWRAHFDTAKDIVLRGCAAQPNI